MALPATDAFTDSNGTQIQTHSSNWSGDNDLDIQSNALAPDGGTGDRFAWWNADTFANNQYAEATVAANTGSGQGYIGPGVRCSGASGNNGYGFYFGNKWSDAYVFKIVTGTYTQLGSDGSTAFSATDTIRIEADGTTITPIRNGSTYTDIGAQTDSSLSSGDAGIVKYSDETDKRIDDWEGGNLGAVAADGLISWAGRTFRRFQPLLVR